MTAKIIIKRIGIFLGIYALILGITLILLMQGLPDTRKAIFITYSFGTGADPVEFQSDLQAFPPGIQYWLLGLHVISWLFVPILVATVIDVIIRELEQKRQGAGDRIKKRIRNVGRATGLRDDVLESYVDEEFEKFRKISGQ